MVITAATQDTVRAVAADTDGLRIRLEKRRAECLRQRGLALAESSTSVPDDVALSRAASLARTVSEIDVALARIAAGSYGTCVRCGEAISLARLEVRPFASTCIACAGTRR